MGHSDSFKGHFTLDRPLDDIIILDILEDWTKGEVKNYSYLKIDGYCQWVVKKDENKKRTIITWDGEEKFYDPDKWILEICNLLNKYGYFLNGVVEWQAEDDIEDLKKIFVVNNVPSVTMVVDMSIVECPECGHKFRTKKD